ncbi:MAG: Fic family protein [Kiritimatiellae bacterium]|nr:Fic family protein [Kiritimatiellia bacterium]
MKKSLSKLAPYEDEIRNLREQAVGFRDIAAILGKKYDLPISHNSVYSFLKNRDRVTKKPVLFYEGLPDDILSSLLKQISALWTHDSTAIEGNTLTLGETVKLLELGLTISGKSLKDHEEVYGHAKAIDLIYELMKKDKIDIEDLFDLHRCVMQKSAIDTMRPIGNWKREFNGTTGVHNGNPVYMEYASPSDTPKLMARWIKEFNRKQNTASSHMKAINVYSWTHLSFVRIHPFFDGNGRIARLIANLPLLRCGQAPILISNRRRAEYIDMLWEYQNAVGKISANDRLLPPHEAISRFKKMLKSEWRETIEMIEKARKQALQQRKNT